MFNVVMFLIFILNETDQYFVFGYILFEIQTWFQSKDFNNELAIDKNGDMATLIIILQLW
jgi:hypothetical protein